MAPRRIIALTPVKNEEYILPSFIQASLKLADIVIIADQNSDDRSVQAASGFENVLVIENRVEQFDEASRQNLLIETARERFGEDNVLLAIDADELFFPQKGTVASIRAELLAYPAGTTLLFDKPTLIGGTGQWKCFGPKFPLGYSDDGIAHKGNYIHSRRIPTGETPPASVTSCSFIHLDLLDKAAHESKRAFYNCLETVSGRTDRKTRWRRGYSRFFRRRQADISPVDPRVQGWFGAMRISLASLRRTPPYWWDYEVLKMFSMHGSRKFWWDSVWHRPWEETLVLARTAGVTELPDEIERPPAHISFLRELMIWFLLKCVWLKSHK